MPNCYVCKKTKEPDAFYADGSRSCGLSSKCKVCADRRRADRGGYAYGGEIYEELDDRAFLEAELNSRIGDYNSVPREWHGGALQADGVKSVRGKKTKNRTTKLAWGKVRGQIRAKIKRWDADKA